MVVSEERLPRWFCCSGWLPRDDYCRRCGMHGPGMARLSQRDRALYRVEHTESERQEVFRLRAEGRTITGIMGITGVARTTIEDWLRRRDASGTPGHDA